MLGRKIGLQNRILLQQALNQTNIGGVIRLAKALFLFSFTVECIAAFILSFEWVPKYGIAKGIYYSFFHSISAFNNAGFSVWSDNLMSPLSQHSCQSRHFLPHYFRWDWFYSNRRYKKERKILKTLHYTQNLCSLLL